MRAIIMWLLTVMLFGCASPMTVRAPVLDLPPVPARLMEPCETPSPLLRGTLEELYLQMLEDAGRWGRCVRNHDALVEIIKYRDSVMATYKAQITQQQSSWFKWPWQ